MRDPQPQDIAAPTLESLEARVDDLAWEMVARFQGEVPGWAEHRAPGFLQAAQEHCVDHVRAFLTVAREQRTLTQDELSFVRVQAELRARQGVPLADLLHVYRIGNRTIFHAVVEAASLSTEGSVVALVLMDRVLAHSDMVTATFTEAYLTERRRMEDGVDDARRRLVERALAGTLDTGDRGADLGRSLGFHQDLPHVVVICAGPGDALPAIAAELARIHAEGDGQGLAVVREREVVAVLGTGGRSPAELRRAVEAVVAGRPHSAGISIARPGLAGLPEAYAEAALALRRAVPGTAVAIPELAPSEYLAMAADDTAHRLMDARVRTALEDDLAGGGVLATTLCAFIDADMSAPAAAESLGVHANTVYYRLDKLRRLTGRNPRRVHDLGELLTAVRMLRGPARG